MFEKLKKIPKISQVQKLLLHLSIFSFALILVLFTVLIPQTVQNKREMRDMKFGFPLAFINQDLTAYDPPFPWKFSFSSPWENSFKFNVLNFLVSYLVVVLICEFLVISVRKSFFVR